MNYLSHAILVISSICLLSSQSFAVSDHKRMLEVSEDAFTAKDLIIQFDTVSSEYEENSNKRRRTQEADKDQADLVARYCILQQSLDTFLPADEGELTEEDVEKALKELQEQVDLCGHDFFVNKEELDSSQCLPSSEKQQNLVVHTLENKEELNIDLNHPLTDTGKKQFKCDFDDCDYTSNNKYLFKQHQMIHRGEKPFVCNVKDCKYSTNLKGNLMKHQMTHTGEKPFVCNVKDCKYSTNQRCYLTRHQMTHTGEKPFFCNVKDCKYSTRQRYHLTRHQRTHTRRN